MIKPAALKTGDLAGIVSTARKLNEAEISEGLSVLRSWGLEVILGDNIYSVNDQFAGTDEQRISDLQKMLYDRSVKAIFCARGGYGTIRVVDMLDFRTFNAEPKWICGFSDITVLHAHLQQQLSCQSLHMPMPLTFPMSTSAAIEKSKDVLFGKDLSYSLEHDNLNREGKAKGILVGGNLSVLYSLLGSNSFPNTDKRILFLEDLDEYLYHIDRMMMALKRAGVLKNIAGLMIGGMTDMNDNENPFGKTAHEIVIEHTADLNIPIIANVPSGHIKNNMPLIMGAEVEMIVGNGSEINFS
ncbi:MAG: LD-carboxypeptidase [Bacteroidia bacterium]|nr:LD-carboxypeptidase [Bacteroidia bacterium]